MSGFISRKLSAMRIAYILADNIRPKGTSGAAAHVRHVMGELTSRGHQVCLVARTSEVAVETSDTDTQRSAVKRLVFDFMPESVKALVRDQRRRIRNRRLVSKNDELIRSCDLMYERDAYQSFGTQALAAECDMPWVLECNGFFWDEQSPFSNPVWPERYRRRHVQKWKAADHLIVVSQSFKEHVVREGVDPQKITVIHNGVDLEPHHDVSSAQVAAFRKEWGIGNEVTVGFLGHMLPWHRIDLLIDAIGQLRASQYNVRGLCVGGGRWKQYEQYARQKGLQDEIVFTGPVPPSRVPVAVAAMDVCTAPGIYEPGSPVKLFDYGAAGRPVVATNAPSVTEIITDTKTGLLFEDGSLEGYIAALKRLLDSENLRAQLGKRLKQKVEREHTWARVGDRTEALLQKVARTYL